MIHADPSIDGGYDNPRSALLRASDGAGLYASGDSLSCAEGSACPPMGITGKRAFAATYKEASTRIQGLKRGGSRFSTLGGLENQSKGTSRRDAWPPRVGRRGLSM